MSLRFLSYFQYLIDRRILERFSSAPNLVNSEAKPSKKIDLLVEDIIATPKILFDLAERFASNFVTLNVRDLPQATEDSNRLGYILDSYGSDKAKNHKYNLYYASALPRTRIRSVLEIGIGSINPEINSNIGIYGKPGASIRAWRDFFPNSQIYAADIDSEILIQEDRVKSFTVDQTDATSLKHLYEILQKLGKFDLIIDDGLHSPHANFQTLYYLLPLLNKNGLFVIEDIRFDALSVYSLLQLVLGIEYKVTFFRAVSTFILEIQKL